jgi:hypothetical protein
MSILDRGLVIETVQNRAISWVMEAVVEWWMAWINSSVC